VGSVSGPGTVIMQADRNPDDEFVLTNGLLDSSQQAVRVNERMVVRFSQGAAGGRWAEGGGGGVRLERVEGEEGGGG